MTLDNKMPKPKLIHVQHEVGYEKDGALDYFHTCTDSKYEDEKKYKVVATKYKEVTDEDDIANGYRDWEWCIEVYKA